MYQQYGRARRGAASLALSAIFSSRSSFVVESFVSAIVRVMPALIITNCLHAVTFSPTATKRPF